MSFYQTLKLVLVDVFQLSKDGFHIILGFFVFLLFARIFKTPLTAWKVLLPTFIFSIALELVDFRDSVVFNARYDFIDSLHDIFITNILPFLTVVFLRLQGKRSGDEERS